jgi:hypothetical protein
MGEVHSKREPGLNPKPRHFKPFEYFDHTRCWTLRIPLALQQASTLGKLFQWSHMRIEHFGFDLAMPPNLYK